MTALLAIPHYYTVEEILSVRSPSLPATAAGISDWARRAGWQAVTDNFEIRPGKGRLGGTIAYHARLLPPDVRAALIERASAGLMSAREVPVTSPVWAEFDRLPDTAKTEARERLAVVDAVDELTRSMTKQAAVALVSLKTDTPQSTIWSWISLVKDVARTDRLPAIAPRRGGGRERSDCDPRAWDYFVADKLRPENPAFSAVYARLIDAAREHGWAPIPSLKTLQRRLEADIPRGARELAVAGRDKVLAMYPHQTRDRSIFTAMEAVNSDGHKFDVFVRWDDGTIGRPILIGVQDLYSGMPVGWRIDRSESWTLVRLAFADMLTNWGVPEHAVLDNGRAFASKYMTGGIRNRYRFKIRDDEPEGILKLSGVQVHWTTPYHGQSKPIERMWRDLCENIAKHPRCAGAYTGNNPLAKPDNYGSRAIPIAEFEALVTSEIARHVTRGDRRAPALRGRSILQAFVESLEAHPPRRISAEHLRMYLCAAEGVTARQPSGEVMLAENRYWAPELADHAGKKLIIRFDPLNLHAGVAVYTRDGRWICDAPVIDATGFFDSEKARLFSADRARYLKAQQALLAAERRLTVAEVADLTPMVTGVARAPAPQISIAPTHDPRAGWSGEADFSRALRLIESAADDL